MKSMRLSSVAIIFTAHKRRLGQGNVFTGVYLTTGGRGLCHRDPPDRGPLHKDPPGQRFPGQTHLTVKSGQYASYRNAFLFILFFTGP